MSCVTTFGFTCFTFPPYLKELSNSIPHSFWDCFSQLTANFALVPLLAVALDARTLNRLLARHTGRDLRDNARILLPWRAWCIRRLPQALRTIDNFMASCSLIFVVYKCVSVAEDREESKLPRRTERKFNCSRVLMEVRCLQAPSEIWLPGVVHVNNPDVGIHPTVFGQLPQRKA